MGTKTYPSQIPPAEVPTLNGSRSRVLPAFQATCALQAGVASAACRRAVFCTVSAGSSVYMF